MAREQVSSIVKALQILECFADNETEWTLKALIKQLGIPSTTMFRQVSTLVERNYLVQDSVRKSYRAGPAFLQLSSAIVGQSDLRQSARPELERLSELVTETINLSILSAHHIFYLDKVETHRTIACTTRVGSRVPAYVTACGKAMLAYKEQRYVEEYCQWMGCHARALTENSITDPARFRNELISVRQRGYATDNGEIERGLVCVAAPVFDMNRKIAAAISISGPDYRMHEDWDLMVKNVCRSAKAISATLGYVE